MSAIPPTPTPQQNYLLNALPTDTRDRIFPYLELVRLPRDKVLHESGEKLRYAYFPADAIVTMLAIIESGAAAEVSMVGNDGVVGITFFMGGDSSPCRAVVQSGGYAYRLLGRRLRDEFDRHGEALVLLLRYTQALITQTAQTAMCNRHHAIDQRLCHLLLQFLDRLPGNDLVVTQEQIANMLGVRRESVTEAAARLKRPGLIECHRGRITVLDRPGTEKRCCECYAVVRKETDRLLPRTAPPKYPVPPPADGTNSGTLAPGTDSSGWHNYTRAYVR